MNTTTEPTQAPTLTPGQEFVDVNFNVGQREDIRAIKQAFADTYDTIERYVSDKLLSTDAQGKGGKIKRLEAIAKTQLELACMAAVKSVTR